MTTLVSTVVRGSQDFAGWQDVNHIDPGTEVSRLPTWLNTDGSVSITDTPSPHALRLLKPSDAGFIYNNGWLDVDDIPDGSVSDGLGGWVLQSNEPEPDADAVKSTLLEMLSKSETIRNEIPEVSAYATVNAIGMPVIHCWLIAMNNNDAQTLRDGDGSQCGFSNKSNKNKMLRLVQHYTHFTQNDKATDHKLSQAIVRIRNHYGDFALIV